MFFKKYEQSHHFCPSPSQLQKQIITEWGVDHTTYHHQPSNLALTGHLGELSPPQLRVLSLQNQQPVLGAADASIDQIDSSQKSLHFFWFSLFLSPSCRWRIATVTLSFVFFYTSPFPFPVATLSTSSVIFCDLLSAPSSCTWFPRHSHLVCRRGRRKMTVTFWYSEKPSPPLVSGVICSPFLHTLITTLFFFYLLIY